MKLSLSLIVVSEDELNDLFFNVGNLLAIQLDDEFNPFSQEYEEVYQYVDVSNQSGENISKIMDSFFNFSFDEIIRVPLYKFLVLKNNDKITILANINSSIFNYASINKIYDLFNNLNSTSLKNNFESQIRNANNYLDSAEFKQDCQFWKQYLLNDKNDYVKFYNITSNNYKNIKIPLSDNLTNFLKEENISKFTFFTAIFSLYLSRINQTRGCLLKTSICEKDELDKNTILKIDYNKNILFKDYLNKIKSSYDVSFNHTKINIENYIDEDVSFYSIYDFTNTNDVDVINGEKSALTLNIFDNYWELVYNEDLFEEIYIEHMIMNINTLIDNALLNQNQICGDIPILCDEEKILISEFCKSGSVEVDDDKTLGLAVHENAINYPDTIAVDDGTVQLTYSMLDRISDSVAHDLLNNYDITWFV